MVHGLRLGMVAKVYYPDMEDDWIFQQKYGRVVEFEEFNGENHVVMAYKNDDVEYQGYRHHPDRIVEAYCGCGRRKLWSQDRERWICLNC